MDKINISASQAQSATAEQMLNIAKQCLMCEPTIGEDAITISDNASPAIRGIVKYFASNWSFNGTVKDINEETIAALQALGAWDENLIDILATYPSMISIVSSLGLNLAEGLPGLSTPMFLSNEMNTLSDYSNAYDDVLASCTFAIATQTFYAINRETHNSYRHAFVLFKPTVMPTGFTITQNDTLAAFVNGKQIATDSESGTITKDLSSYINLNEWNLLQLRMYHTSQGSGYTFAFTTE